MNLSMSAMCLSAFVSSFVNCKFHLFLINWYTQTKKIIAEDHCLFHIHVSPFIIFVVVVVQSLSHIWLFCDPMNCSTTCSLSFTVSWHLLKLMSIGSMMWSNHIILCHPFPSCLQSFPPSGSFLISQLFKPGDQSIGTSASALVLPENMQGPFPLGLTGLISLQSKGHSSIFSSTTKASTLWHSSFFMVQLSQLYMTSGKIIALIIQTFVSKMISPFFNTPSSFVIAFLPRSKRLLISWLLSPSTVILEPKKIKSVTISTFSPSICHEVMGPDAMILIF